MAQAIFALSQKGEDGKPINLFLQKIIEFADIGFMKWSWVSKEDGKAFRISTTSNGLGRILGFFDAGDFIAVKFFLKRKGKLGPSERGLIHKVNKICDEKDWTKKEE